MSNVQKDTETLTYRFTPAMEQVASLAGEAVDAKGIATKSLLGAVVELVALFMARWTGSSDAAERQETFKAGCQRFWRFGQDDRTAAQKEQYTQVVRLSSRCFARLARSKSEGETKAILDDWAKGKSGSKTVASLSYGLTRNQSEGEKEPEAPKAITLTALAKATPEQLLSTIHQAGSFLADPNHLRLAISDLTKMLNVIEGKSTLAMESKAPEALKTPKTSKTRKTVAA